MISNIIRNFNRKEEDINVGPVGPYLEFRSSTPMTITPNYTNTGITLQYSLDTITWNNISAKGVTPSANIIYFRGSATGTKSLFTANSTSNAWIFTGATNLEAIGNINMLIQDALGGSIEDTTLANRCYNSMFYNCTSLVTAPTLPATTLATSCYNSMFYNCTSLTTTPELPATTLATSCYSGMFYNCTNLTTPPVLPATTLANNCYSYMFRGCIKIKLSTTKTGSYVNEYRVPTVGTGTNVTGALTDMFTGTGGTFKSTPTINTTYYTENQVI